MLISQLYDKNYQSTQVLLFCYDRNTVSSVLFSRELWRVSALIMLLTEIKVSLIKILLQYNSFIIDYLWMEEYSGKSLGQIFCIFVWINVSRHNVSYTKNVCCIMFYLHWRFCLAFRISLWHNIYITYIVHVMPENEYANFHFWVNYLAVSLFLL